MRPYHLGIYEKALPADLSWEEKIQVAREAGFDYLELSVDETDARRARLDWTAQERRELVDLLAKENFSFRSMCLSAHRKYPLGDPDPQKQEEGLVIMQKAVDLAADLGIRLIQLAGYDTYYEEGSDQTRADFSKNLKKAVEMAAKRGVLLGFETMETPFMDTVEKAMQYVHENRNPYLGVYPDIGNLKNASLLYGTPVTEDLKTGWGHIFASHLKETLPGHYRDIPFSTGHTEYPACIEVLKSMGVRMFVGEFWYQGSPHWKEDVVFAANFLRGHLDAVFEKN